MRGNLINLKFILLLQLTWHEVHACHPLKIRTNSVFRAEIFILLPSMREITQKTPRAEHTRSRTYGHASKRRSMDM